VCETIPDRAYQVREHSNTDGLGDDDDDDDDEDVIYSN
jgi:hypothetical protein